jgi:hypothetical protein
VIATNHEEPVQLLLDRFQKLEGDFARVQTELEDLRRRLATIVPPAQEASNPMSRAERVAKAQQEIFTEYDSLLSELAK